MVTPLTLYQGVVYTVFRHSVLSFQPTSCCSFWWWRLSWSSFLPWILWWGILEFSFSSLVCTPVRPLKSTLILLEFTVTAITLRVWQKWKSLSRVRLCLQARILEWVVSPFSRGSSWPRNWARVSCIAGRFFTNWAIREALKLIIRNWQMQKNMASLFLQCLPLVEPNQWPASEEVWEL